jgi:hypothetical protein
MSTPIEPAGERSQASKISQEGEEATMPHHVKAQLQQSANELLSAIQHIAQNKDMNEPIPQDAIHMLDHVRERVESVVPEVNGVGAQNALNDAVQQIQLVIQNPQATMDPAGQLTHAYETLTDTLQST